VSAKEVKTARNVKKKKRRKLRKGFVYFLVVLILIFPAIYVYDLIKEMTSDDINGKYLMGVVLTHSKGEVKIEDDDTVYRFADLINNAVPISDPARDISEYQKLTLTARKLTKEFVYKIYLSESYEDCLIEDKEGSFARLDKDSALMLLLMEELGYIYEYSSLPSYTVTAGDKKVSVLPYEYDWHYRIASGEYRSEEKKDDEALSSSDRVVISKDKKLSVIFDTEPDWLYIKLFSENGSAVYEGDMESFASFNIDNDMNYTAQVSAKWYKTSSNSSEERNYYGNITLQFHLIFDKAATCTLSNTSAYPGELLVLKIVDGRNETFEVKTDLITSPVNFFDLDNARYAFIPVDCDNTAGKKRITVSGSFGNEYTLEVNIASKEFNALSLDPSKYGCTPSEYLNANASLKKQLEALYETSVPQKLWEGNFIYPTSDKTTWIDTRFGAVWSVLGTNGKIRNAGITYAANGAGENVLASNNGKVVFSGEHPLAGNMIIIDHGNGVRTHYYHLGTLNASVGDSVIKGQVIGKLGKSGFISKNGIMFAVTVNGVSINPYYPCTNGIIK